MLNPPAHSWVHAALYQAVSRIEGVGVFTAERLPAGETVIIWGGTIFTAEQVQRGEARQHTNVGVEDGLYLASPAGGELTLDDFMNHSCGPNLGMQDPITIVTRRVIEPGEELTADYAIWLDDPAYIMKRSCNCGSAICRGIIRGTDWQLPAVQDNNRGYFSPFIGRRIAQRAECVE